MCDRLAWNLQRRTGHCCLLLVLPMLWWPIGGDAATDKKPSGNSLEFTGIDGDTAEGRPLTKSDLQSDVMSYADRFAATIGQAAMVFAGQGRSAQVRLMASHSKTYGISAAFEVAAGPNPEVALLDMVVLTTLSRIIWENHWQPKVFVNSGMVMVDAWRTLEKDIWTVAARVLSDEQKKDLRDLIEDWRSKNPNQVSVHLIRFSNFGDTRYESSLADAEKPGGLFKTVKQVTNVLEEADQIVERVMWLVVRMQLILNFQMEQAFLGVVTSPEVTSILSDANRITQIGEEVSQTFTQLLAQITKERTAALTQFMRELGEERRAAINHAMDRLAAEREAAVIQVIDRFMEQLSVERKHFMQDLKVEGDALRPVLAELRETLKTGSDAAKEINAVVASVNDLIARTDAASPDPKQRHSKSTTIVRRPPRSRTLRSGSMRSAIRLTGYWVPPGGTNACRSSSMRSGRWKITPLDVRSC